MSIKEDIYGLPGWPVQEQAMAGNVLERSRRVEVEVGECESAYQTTKNWASVGTIPNSAA
jgi:hypothetical protein